MVSTRFESSVTAISWIPSETIAGLSKVPFGLGLPQSDEPPPDWLEDLEELRHTDRFREVNELRAFIEVEDGRIVRHGHLGQGHIGAATIRVGPGAIRFPAVHLPDIRPQPAVTATSVRFVQTVGGRMGAPLPRPVRHTPFVRLWPSIGWTTLGLTIGVDGGSSRELVGASAFPRHFIYDHGGRLVQKSAVVDFATWSSDSSSGRTPWGASDSPAVVAAVESELERQLSASIMRGGTKPTIRTLSIGETLLEQGAPGTEIYLVLDGIFAVKVDGKVVAEIGPGAVVGERAALEGGERTATLSATTSARVAEVPPAGLDPRDLGALAATHHREQDVPAKPSHRR